ncbi:hypothetical protein FJT64_018365 [Amphibalanus amphitrite]|uniref:Uncharacterized protein n=1 Tax=Amphibalanus amphitrite TaxID=1232801 RepID=A0A6A4X3J7_AMPAM|nr:hypothetical protein FJT64_018365 [Amphibalanus amphitrite]
MCASRGYRPGKVCPERRESAHGDYSGGGGRDGARDPGQFGLLSAADVQQRIDCGHRQRLLWEFSMVDCNHRNSDHYNNMMVGIQDNEGFVDVFQNCGANQVITGLGSSTYYTQDVIRMTCSDVSGAAVSDNCTDLTITEEMQSDELDPQLTGLKGGKRGGNRTGTSAAIFSLEAADVGVAYSGQGRDESRGEEIGALGV